MHFIDEKVCNLIKKYKTTDPYEICYEKKIVCTIMDMHPKMKGVYQNVKNQKFIYLNKKISKEEQNYTCYHELGHAVLHEKYNCTFLKTCTYFNVNKFEKEAEFFVSCFLIPDTSIMLNLNGLTIDEISYKLNVPKEYLKLRFENYR